MGVMVGLPSMVAASGRDFAAGAISSNDISQKIVSTFGVVPIVLTFMNPSRNPKQTKTLSGESRCRRANTS